MTSTEATFSAADLDYLTTSFAPLEEACAARGLELAAVEALIRDRALPEKKTREFDYRLRPRSDAVREIPTLRFAYFNPKIQPPEQGYQTTIAPAIQIRVRPRAQVRAQST